MSAADPGAGAGAGHEALHRTLAGWGRTAATAADVVHALDRDVVDRVVDGAAQAVAARGAGQTGARGLVARGLGRSYGDAAQNAGGTVVDATWLDAVHHADLERGLVTVGAGVSLQTLMERLVPLGWFVPVTPGTRLVTVGGAIAADIHGKNHHVDGSFCSHVTELTLVTPTGTRVVTPEGDPELFWATAGGMGLTGVVVEATLRMVPIDTSYMLVDTERADDLDDVMDRMVTGDDDYRYSVAWIDCQRQGVGLGRSVLTRGDHARLEDLPRRLRSDPAKARAFEPRVLARVPLTPPGGLLNPLTVAAFNEFWFRKAPRHQVAKPHHLGGFFHPLDGVADWNRLYGPRGFLQYQFVVPDEAGEVVRSAISQLAEHRLASFLAVLKRFGPGDPGPLSFPMPGWTLALDLPVGHPVLDTLLDRLDEEVVASGGRIYLAKDSRVSPETLRAMYPRVDDFLAVKAGVDPDGVLASDLGRRVGLCPTVPAAPAKKAVGRRAAAKAAALPVKNAATSRKAPSKKAPSKKAPSKKAPSKKAPTKSAATAKKAPAKKATAAKNPAAADPAEAAAAADHRPTQPEGSPA